MAPPTRWTILSVTGRYALCGAAMYWTYKQGIWAGFCQSQEVYDKTSSLVQTSIRRIEKRYGIRIIRDEETVKRELRHYTSAFWNLGIQKVVFFSANVGDVCQGYYTSVTSGKYLEKEDSADVIEEEDTERFDKGDAKKIPPQTRDEEPSKPGLKRADTKPPDPQADTRKHPSADEKKVSDASEEEKKSPSTLKSDERKTPTKSPESGSGGVQPSEAASGQTTSSKSGDKIIIKGHEVDAKKAERLEKIAEKIKKIHGM